MEVVSACPLRVASIMWQPRPNAFALTVVALATYTLLPGESPLADDQEEPNEADGHWNDDERRSLHVASDLAPFKPRADVYLLGHAYAPGGEPVTSLMTRFVVGALDKSIAVHGDRAFTPEGELRKPAPFVRMPLRWERAAGGPYTVNPVGMRADAPDAQGMIHVPNLLPPGVRAPQRGDLIEPVGYGPIAPTWPGRLARLGRHAATWDHLQWNQHPLPSDIDPAYFNVAPPDQQLDDLRASDRIALENLHPDYPRLLTTLAQAIPHAMIEREGGAQEPLALRCDTLTIDADRGQCTLAWRGAFTLRHPYEAGRVRVAADEAARSSRPVSSPPRRAEVPDAPPMRRAQTLVGSQRLSTALPFVPSAGPSPSAPAPQPPLGAALPFVPSARPPPNAPAPPPSASPNAGLPFKPAPPGPAPGPASGPAPGPPSTPPQRQTLPTLPDEDPPQLQTLPTPPDDATRPAVGPQRVSSALPFVSSAQALSALSAPPTRPAPPLPPMAPPPAPAPPAWGNPPSAFTVVPTPTPVAPIAAPPLPVAPIAAAPLPVAPVATPRPPLPPPPLADEPPPYYVTPQPLPVAPIAPRSVPPPPPPPPPPLPSETPRPPAPPPMLGPLATPAMVQPSIQEATQPAPPPSAAPASDLVLPPVPWALPLETYPLERCAAIAASIARRPAERALVLDAQGLEPEQWAALDQHWNEVIRKQTERGRSKLLVAYDTAYVAQLEAERGPIDVKDYARIVVAAERGEEGQALFVRGLPRAALIRIQRVWLRRLAGDPTLAATARKELDAAREEDG